MKKLTALLLLLPVLASADEGNVRLGKYSCLVEAAHPNNVLARSYVGSRLEYDADSGVLQLAQFLDIDGERSWLPPQTICSSLIVEAEPSIEGILHAVQFNRRSEGEFRPFVAWLKIDKGENMFGLPFVFFSTGIEGLGY